MSEIETMSYQTPRDMVFSQTSLNTQSVLKVVELDRLKAEKNQQVNGLTGVVIDGNPSTTPPSPLATTSCTEEYLKPEPLSESTMPHDLDYESFQDLRWSFAPAKEELVQTIDSPKKTEERALQIDTQYTLFSPSGREPLDANTSYNSTGYYTTTPIEPLSPNIEGFGETAYDENLLKLLDMEKDNNFPSQEKFLDLNSLPVVIRDLASETVAGTVSWPSQDPYQWTNTHDIDHNQTYTTHHTQPFIDPEEDSLDLKYGPVIPRELESNNVVIAEYIINHEQGDGVTIQDTKMQRQGEALSVDVSARAPLWPAISTPEVLSYVEQLEKEKGPQYFKPQQQWPQHNVSTSAPQDPFTTRITPPPLDYEPITPKSESHVESEEDVKITSSRKRRLDSEESDETYTPHSETPPKKLGKKRKPSVPIKDMIMALEGSQTHSPVRRGRPPKRRESTVSSVCSVDENSSSISTQEMKYRELRDKNNEASKRSRMNRKLKELQMEQLCVDLEEKNKNLQIRADILENMVKRLKNELMAAMLNK